jgi:hypothetical protein
MILGLDCSTTVCGWAFFDGTNIIDAGFLDISKFETNKQKASAIVQFLIDHPKINFLKEIKLEAALSGFMGGRTSQQVVILLARFNAVLEYILSEYFNRPVTLVGASTARKKVLGKAFIKGVKATDYGRQRLPEVFPEIVKFDQLNKKGEWNAKNSDMYDAAVISAT